MALVDFTPDRDTLIQFMGTPRLLDWFAEHQVDGTTVPLDSRVHFDSETYEWRFEQFVTDENGPVFDPVAGEAKRRVLRRAAKSMPPWVG